MLFPEPNEAEDGLEALLGMGFRGNDPFGYLRRVGPGFATPPDEPFWRPLDILLMTPRHVLFDGRVAPRAVAPEMGGDTLIAKENLHRLFVVTYFDDLLD